VNQNPDNPVILDKPAGTQSHDPLSEVNRLWSSMASIAAIGGSGFSG